MALGRTSPLDERIKSIRAEIDALIDEHVKQLAKDCPGVPAGALRATLIGNEPCQCEAFVRLSEAGTL